MSAKLLLEACLRLRPDRIHQLVEALAFGAAQQSAAGTLTSLKNSSDVSCDFMPSLSSTRPT